MDRLHVAERYANECVHPYSPKVHSLIFLDGTLGRRLPQLDSSPRGAVAEKREEVRAVRLYAPCTEKACTP